MKIKKSLLLLVLMLSLVLSGCNYEAMLADVLHDLANQLTEPEDVVEDYSQQPTEPEVVIEPFIGCAATEVENTDELLQLKPEELKDYISEYNKYNNYFYFQHLNETEKLLYRAYEYALDHALPYIVMDDRLLLGMSRPAFQVLEFLSLDSAVVEQNISYSQDGYYDVESYTSFFVENFTEEKLKHKKAAFKEAHTFASRSFDSCIHLAKEGNKLSNKPYS